jgi:hypothetical protein
MPDRVMFRQHESTRAPRKNKGQTGRHRQDRALSRQKNTGALFNSNRLRAIAALFAALLFFSPITLICRCMTSGQRVASRLRFGTPQLSSWLAHFCGGDALKNSVFIWSHVHIVRIRKKCKSTCRVDNLNL